MRPPPRTGHAAGLLPLRAARLPGLPARGGRGPPVRRLRRRVRSAARPPRRAAAHPGDARGADARRAQRRPSSHGPSLQARSDRTQRRARCSARGRWCPPRWRTASGGGCSRRVSCTSAHPPAFNMLALWVLGRDLELVLGRARFLALYLVSLLGGSAAVDAARRPQRSRRGRLRCGVRPDGRRSLVVLRTAAAARMGRSWRPDRDQPGDQQFVLPGISGRRAPRRPGDRRGGVTAALVYAPAPTRPVSRPARWSRSPPCCSPRSRSHVLG